MASQSYCHAGHDHDHDHDHAHDHAHEEAVQEQTQSQETATQPEAEIDDGVLALKDDNIDEFLKTNDYVFIEFYARYLN